MSRSCTNLDGFELLAETLGEMVSRHAPDTTYTYASGASRTLFGFEPEELVGHSAYGFLHPDDVDDVRGAHSTLPTGSTSATGTGTSAAATSSARRAPGRCATRQGR